MRKCFIFIIAAAFMAVSAMPATAQDDGGVSISGGVMVQTFWNNVDSVMNNEINGGAAPFSDTDVNWSVVPPGTSITFQFKKGDISGRITMRPFIAPSAQQVWGAWNFGAGTLTIGNFNMPFSNRTQAALHHLGGNSHWAGNIDIASRDRGLMLTFPAGGGTLKLAAFRPSGVARGAASIVSAASGAAATATTADTDTVIPKLEASYDVKFGGFNLWIGGGYQSYSEVVTSTDKEYDIDSWGVGIYGSYGFGPITINGSAHRMDNAVEYGFGGTGAPHPFVPYNAAAFAAYDAAADGIIDSEMFGFHFSAGWKISDMLSLQAGFGRTKFERDRDTGVAAEVADWEDTTQFYYINMPIFAAKGFTITPEIGIRDEDDAIFASGRAATATQPAVPAGGTVDQGDTTYYGVRWFIRF